MQFIKSAHMPNHVTNLLQIEASPELYLKIISDIQSTDEKGEINHIDFNTFFPMPEELKGTTSPSKIQTPEEVKAWHDKKAAGTLTSWESDSRPITQKESQDYKRKFGADNWYEWTTKNWGTKWGAYDTNEENGIISFLTAWSTPVAALSGLSRKYPEADFTVQFADEDFSQNCGEYTLRAGIMIADRVPEGGSVEAILKAAEILGENHLDYALGEDYEQDEYSDKCIEVAHILGCFGEFDTYHPEVIKKLIDKAVIDEQYERAKQLNDLLAEAEKK